MNAFLWTLLGFFLGVPTGAALMVFLGGTDEEPIDGDGYMSDAKYRSRRRDQ